MLDKLFEFLKSQINNILPFTVVYQYNKAVRLRFGKFNQVLEPGFYWKIPYIDTIISEQSVDTTMLLPAQSVITKDRKEIVVKGCIGYKIDNIGKFICNVWDTRGALADKTCSIIKETISFCDFIDCMGNNLDYVLTKTISKQVKKYGIKINFVSLVDITESKSIRLFNETGNILV